MRTRFLQRPNRSEGPWVIFQAIQEHNADRLLTWGVQRIARLMLPDLKLQKLMHRIYRLGVLAADHHAAAVFHLLIRVPYLVLQLLHRGHAWRSLVMHKHGDIEITGAEGMLDMVQV